MMPATEHLDPIDTVYRTAHISSLTESRPLSVCIMTWKVTAHKEVALGMHPDAPGRMAQAIDCLETEYIQLDCDWLWQKGIVCDVSSADLRKWLDENRLADCRIEGE